MKVLHVIATPRSSKSNTLLVSDEFLKTLRSSKPGVEVEVLDLFKHDLPAIAGRNIDTKYTLMSGGPIDPQHAQSWRDIERLIEHFLAADAYVLSAPMWNLGIPYALKYYIDCIVQPGYLFRYNELGIPVGMVQGKRMVCVAGRGADYSIEPMRSMDFHEPYLRTIFGFVGITDLRFINVQPTDVSSRRDAAIAAALAEARSIASKEWGAAAGQRRRRAAPTKRAASPAPAG